MELGVWGAKHPVGAKGCLQHSTTTLHGQWELISAGWALALGEKTTAVMNRLFFYVSFWKLADVIGEVSSCAKCTWLTTSVGLSEVLQIIVDHPQCALVCGWFKLTQKDQSSVVHLCRLLSQVWAAISKKIFNKYKIYWLLYFQDFWFCGPFIYLFIHPFILFCNTLM